jgi:hypothetical protein
MVRLRAKANSPDASEQRCVTTPKALLQKPLAATFSTTHPIERTSSIRATAIYTFHKNRAQSYRYVGKKCLTRQKCALRLLICSVVPGRSVLFEGSVASDGLVELATTQFLLYFRSFEEYIRQNVVNGKKSVGGPNHGVTSDSPTRAGGGKKRRKNSKSLSALTPFLLLNNQSMSQLSTACPWSSPVLFCAGLTRRSSDPRRLSRWC